MSQCVVPFSLIIIYRGSNKERLQNKTFFVWYNCFGFFYQHFLTKCRICLFVFIIEQFVRSRRVKIKCFDVLFEETLTLM